MHLVSPPIEVQRADALYDFLQMHTNAGKAGSTLSGEFWSGRLDGVSGTFGFPLERRVLLMLVTMLISAMGVNRTLLQRISGRFSTRSNGQPRCGRHCSHLIAAKQTMSTERS